MVQGETHARLWRHIPSQAEIPTVASVEADLAVDPMERRLFWAAMVPIFLAMTISGNFLDLVGLNYDQLGGNQLTKIHPSIYAAVGLTMFAFWGRLGQVLLRNKLLLWFFVLLAISNLVVIVLNPENGLHAVAQNLVCYVGAGLICLVLAESGPETHSAVARLIITLAVVNAMICILEDATQHQLIPTFEGNLTYVPATGSFRGTAFYENPLDGATMTLIGLLVLIGHGVRRKTDQAAFLILLAGLISFGGRTAMVIGVLVLCIGGSVHFLSQILRGKMTFSQAAQAFAIAFVIPLLFLLLLTETNLGERIVNHFYWDNSAQTRTFQWDILGQMRPKEFLTGMTYESMILGGYQISVFHPFEDIENPWLLEFVDLGIVGFLIWLASFSCILVHCWRNASGWGKVLFVSYLLVSFSSNSFGRKSVVFEVFAPAVVCTYDLRRRRREAEMVNSPSGPTQDLDFAIRPLAN